MNQVKEYNQRKNFTKKINQCVVVQGFRDVFLQASLRTGVRRVQFHIRERCFLKDNKFQDLETRPLPQKSHMKCGGTQNLEYLRIYILCAILLCHVAFLAALHHLNVKRPYTSYLEINID